MNMTFRDVENIVSDNDIKFCNTIETNDITLVKGIVNKCLDNACKIIYDSFNMIFPQYISDDLKDNGYLDLDEILDECMFKRGKDKFRTIMMRIGSKYDIDISFFEPESEWSKEFGEKYLNKRPQF